MNCNATLTDDRPAVTDEQVDAAYGVLYDRCSNYELGITDADVRAALEAAAAARQDAEPIEGWWWCERVNRPVNDAPVWDHGGGIIVCKGPHRALEAAAAARANDDA